MLSLSYMRVVNTNFSPHLIYNKNEKLKWFPYKPALLEVMAGEIDSKDNAPPLATHVRYIMMPLNHTFTNFHQCKTLWEKSEPPVQQNDKQIDKEDELVAHARIHLEHQFKFEEDGEYPGFPALTYYGCAVGHKDNEFILIAQPPRMVQKHKNEGAGLITGEKDMPSRAATTYYGPIHWLVVAQAIKTSLLISSWVSCLTFLSVSK